MLFNLVAALDYQIKLGYEDGACKMSSERASVVLSLPLKNKTCEGTGISLGVRVCDATSLTRICERDIEIQKYYQSYLKTNHVGEAYDCEYKLVQSSNYDVKVKGASSYFSLNKQFKMSGLDKNNPFHYVVTTCSQGRLMQYFCDDADTKSAMCFPSLKILTPENLFCSNSKPCSGLEWIPNHLIDTAGDRFTLFDDVIMRERRRANEHQNEEL